MKIDIEFKGLEELVKAFESAASDEDIAQVNKAIAEKGEPVVQRIMSGKIPKSKDIKKSGRGFGSKSSVSAHAADEIPIGKVMGNDLQTATRVHICNRQGGRCRTTKDSRTGISSVFRQDSGVISMGSSPDIIKDASDVLKPIEDRGITVMQGWYDKDLNKCHVTLWDLGETDDNFSDDDAEGVTLSLQVTIFSKEDEVELAREIKSLMKENGFSFEGRNGDDSKPEDGIYMKAQRFTKYYESEEKS